MSARRLRTLATAIALAVALLVPVSAFAATAPAAGGPIDVQAWNDNGTLVVVTALTIPETTKLPTTVRIPIPAGSQVQWAGEVLGGDPAADPARTYAIKKSPVGGEYAEFTVESTRSAQVDTNLSVVQTTGTTTSAAFDWVQSVSSPVVSISLRAPAGATNVVLAPKPTSSPEFNSAGEALYSGDPLVLKPGSTTHVALSYTAAGAGTGGSAKSAGGSSSLIYFLIATLVVVAGILVVVLVRQRENAAAPSPAPEARDARRPQGAVPTQPAEESKDADDSDWGFDDSDE